MTVHTGLKARSMATTGQVTKPAVLAFAPGRWDGLWMNRQQLLSRLARRGWPVTYSTGALTVWDRGSDLWQTAPWINSYEAQDGVSVETPGKMLLRWPRFATADRLVVRLHAASLARRERRVASDTIAHVFHPLFQPYAKALGCRWTIYHAYDVYAQQPGWTDSMARMEEELIASADIVIASGAAILNALPGVDRERSVVLPNGADSAEFALGPTLPCPEDLSRIPQPRIGYIGNVNRKIDFPMIAALAQERPDWHWVMVGPVRESGLAAPAEDPQIASAYHLCRQLPNVHFLGHKDRTELPAYAGHMTVNTICYRGDEGWWTSAMPLKLHEYLATGTPVVSLDLTDLHEHADVVRLVDSVDGWRRAIEAALNDRSSAAQARRRDLALANSWDERVDRLEHLLEGMVRGDQETS
jgi:glycosyltransferase involved in cell wall biosynthesis